MLIKKADKFKSCTNFSSVSWQEYSNKIYRYTDKQVRKIYKAVFGHECEMDVVWARYLIQYELCRQQYIKEGKTAPLEKNSQFRKAYTAVQKMDIAHVNENLKTLIVYDIKHKENVSQESIMKKQAAIKKAVEVKKAKCIGITLGLTVTDTWEHVFRKNAKDHKTDEEITKFLLAEFPDHKIKAFYNINTCRNQYNNGRFTKGVKPEVKSVRYGADGNVLGRVTKKAAPVKKAEPAPAPVTKKTVKSVIKKSKTLRVSKK